MPTPLSPLRHDLEFLPSPVSGQPGLLVRDPYRYSDVTLIVPPLLTRCLPLFDGAHSDLDLRELLVRLTGRLDDVGEIVEQMLRSLSEAGFLRDTAFDGLRARRERAFAESPLRAAVHAGGGYPDDPRELELTVARWREERSVPRGAPPVAEVVPDGVIAIAAPHASPHAAVPTYAAAYRALPDDARDRTFVVLGTSHYGEPSRFGITRKAFQTPFGAARTDVALVDELARAAPEAFTAEDYCHAIEHSIEFQVLFLQSRFGPDVRILPILCGPFWGARPEDAQAVARGLDALGAMQASHGARLTWVLGVDMAHVGPRYGDRQRVRAHQGEMLAVTERDRARLDRVAAGDADGFWRLVRGDGGSSGRDDLKWCGSAPLYAFLRAVPGVRARLLHYDHWNIDDDSVVSFAAMAFSAT
ncbi:MAG TPA: AmmeMemoRadiSam system protein B [Polyangia bacterium]